MPFFRQLHYFSLPSALTKSRVLLLDATIATGAAALMAIRVLLDHDVAEENIVLLALLAAPQGTVAMAHPRDAVAHLAHPQPPARLCECGRQA